MGEPAVTVRNGVIFWRGRCKPADEAIRLRDHFRAAAAAEPGDWFNADRLRFAADLDAALRQTQPMEAPRVLHA